MSAGSTGRGPDLSALIVSLFIFCGLLLIPTTPAAAPLPEVILNCPEPVLDSSWYVVWRENFDEGGFRDWTCERYTDTEIIRLETAHGSTTGDKSLFAYCPGGQNGAGYRAVSPNLAPMGLDYELPYVIRFSFMAPTAGTGGLFVLQTNVIHLAIRNLDYVDSTAEFGWTDVQSTEFHPLGELNLDQWYRIQLRIEPAPVGPQKHFQVRVNGEVRGSGQAPAHGFTSLGLFDPPYAIRNPSSGDPLLVGHSCGYWDDYVVFGHEPPERPGSHRIYPDAPTPNPFNPITRVDFELTEPTPITATVYSVDGRRVVTLQNGLLPAGPHRLVWRGRDRAGCAVASGIYLLRLVTPEETHNLKMTLTR